MKKFNYLESRWHNIEPEKNKNMRKSGFVLITRPVTRSGLIKGRGQMVTSMSVKPEQLPKSARAFAEAIVKQY